LLYKMSHAQLRERDFEQGCLSAGLNGRSREDSQAMICFWK